MGIEVKYSRDDLINSTDTESHTSKNCLLSPFLLKSLIETSIHAANDEMKVHPSIRDSVNLVNLAHSMESSMPKVVSSRRVTEPTMPTQQSVPKSCLLDH
ncbi:hypothetical protein ACTXT7_015777 [Hymenolepis weldensis]